MSDFVNTYQAEQRAKTERLGTIIDGVVEALNAGPDKPGWVRGKADNDGDRDYLTRSITHPAGYRLFFSEGYNAKGKIHVSGSWPSNNAGDTYTPRDRFTEAERADIVHDINVSADKAPAQIARDIARRLLPTYTAAFDALKEHAANNDTYRADIRTIAGRLAPLFNVDISWAERQRSTSATAINLYSRFHHAYSVEVNSPTSISVDVRNMTEAQAGELAALLRRWDDAKPKGEAR